MAGRRAPAGMGATGLKFWRDITGKFELSSSEFALLESACRELALIDRLEAKLKGAQLVVTGSMGQQVAHPLLAEVRQHRAAFAALVKALKLPDEDVEETPKSPRSIAAQRAAKARWARGA